MLDFFQTLIDGCAKSCIFAVGVLIARCVFVYTNKNQLAQILGGFEKKNLRNSDFLTSYKWVKKTKRNTISG